MRARNLLPALSLVFTLLAGANEGVVLPEQALPGLEPLLRNAVTQSPRMLNRALDLEIAENNRVQSRSGLLPNVGGYARLVEARDDRADQANTLTVSKNYYDFSVTQPLYFWGERTNNARIAEIQEQISGRNYREAYRGLAQEIRHKYLQLIVHKTMLQRARLYQVHVERERAVAEERHSQGALSDLQIHPIRLAVEQGQIALERIEFDFESAKSSFARLAGVQRLDDGQIPDAVPVLGYQGPALDRLVAAFLSLSEPATPEAVNARDQLAIEELHVRNAKTRLRPKFSLVAGLSQDEQAYTLNSAQKYRVNSLYGGVSMQWTLFDGFAAQAATRNALARRRQAQNDYDEMTDRLARQAQTQSRHLNFSARNMAIMDRFLHSAEGGLRGKQEEFSRGVASESEVRLAELALYDSRINAYNHRIDFLLKMGDLLGTLGSDPVLNHLAQKK